MPRCCTEQSLNPLCKRVGETTFSEPTHQNQPRAEARLSFTIVMTNRQRRNTHVNRPTPMCSFHKLARHISWSQNHHNYVQTELHNCNDKLTDTQADPCGQARQALQSCFHKLARHISWNQDHHNYVQRLD